MAVTIEEVHGVAELARLRFSPAEEERLAGELNRILRYMDTLNELDTTGVEPTSHVLPLANAFRHDEAASFSRRGRNRRRGPAAPRGLLQSSENHRLTIEKRRQGTVAASLFGQLEGARNVATEYKGPKYVVVTGGVISGVGKGLTTASIGKILQQYGYSTTAVKIDPYINYDAGTMRPTEHGEVWVTDDGGEIDQDLGNYERFLGLDLPRSNNLTTGQIYLTVIERERRGEYLGETVQPIPHITDEITRRLQEAGAGYDIVLVEIGGIVGDYENEPFLFAVKTLERDLGEEHFAHLIITYLPIPPHVGEMKTKPTQQAIRMLSEHGIFPDFIVCRAETATDEVRKKKIQIGANVPYDHIISAPDSETIYNIPLVLEKERLGEKILSRVGCTPKKTPDWRPWLELVKRSRQPRQCVRVAMVGKYVVTGDFQLTDS